MTLDVQGHGSGSKVGLVKPSLKVMILAGGLTPTSSCIFVQFLELAFLKACSYHIAQQDLLKLVELDFHAQISAIP